MDNDIHSDTESVDTNEAFMEMIGLCHTTNYDFLTEADQEDTSNVPDYFSSSLTPLEYSNIPLPPKCSRHLLPPSSNVAIVIDNVLSESQCRYLIQKAEQSSQGFQYITEASHKSPDGMSYTVQIQNPNPHKLAVIDTDHNPFSSSRCGYDESTRIMDELYDKILCILNDPDNSTYQKFASRTNCKDPQGLNPRMRILKYDAENNDKFEAHFDATTYISKDNPIGSNVSSSVRNQSLITILVYLNDGDGKDFDGGETLYLDYHNSSTSSSARHRSLNVTSCDANVKVIPQLGRVVLFEHDLFHSGSLLHWGTKYVMRTDVLFEEIDNDLIKRNGISCASASDTQEKAENESVSNKPELMSNICNEMNISKKDILLLEEMQLLQITPEAFISPGVTLLKQMLIDAGMECETVLSLVQRAMKSLNT
mmetsp:Transcript_12620/g.15516  ORF Transcript_12620/g.15516 Transcript_12620/m.15516 type:complete len:424 (+) Transcript_12620:504-1775(+)